MFTSSLTTSVAMNTNTMLLRSNVFFRSFFYCFVKKLCECHTVKKVYIMMKQYELFKNFNSTHKEG